MESSPPATVGSASTDDRWKTLLWRQEELERAGWPAVAALVVADRIDIDLHDACDLVRQGATVQQALDILL